MTEGICFLAVTERGNWCQELTMILAISGRLVTGKSGSPRVVDSVVNIVEANINIWANLQQNKTNDSFKDKVF